MTIIFDTQLQMAFVTVSPIQVTFIDTCNCTRLYVMVHDNIYNQAELTYHLTCDDGTFKLTGRCIIEGSAYTSWLGDNEFPFTFVATLLNVTISS